MTKLYLLALFATALSQGGCSAAKFSNQNSGSVHTDDDHPALTPAPTVTPAPSGILVSKYDPKCFPEPKLFDSKIQKPVQKYAWGGINNTSYNQVMANATVLPKPNGKGTRLFFNTFLSGISQSNYLKNGRLVALDGVTGTQLWSSSFPTHASKTPAGTFLKIGDVEKQVIYVLRDAGGGVYNLMAVDADTGAEIWTNSTEKAANTNFSTNVDISVASSGGKTVVLAGNVYDGVTGKLIYNSQAEFAFELRSDSPGLELLTSTGIHTLNSGSELCKFPLPITFPAAGNTKDHGGIVAGRVGSMMKVYNNQCKEILSVTIPTDGGGPITIADYNGDGRVDFAMAGATKYVVFDLSGSIIRQWDTVDGSSRVTGSTSFDFNGDGYAEAVYNDEHFLRIYEGRSGKVLYEIENPSGTYTEYPVIADVDGDGHADIVVAANNFMWGTETGLRVFSAPDNSWLNTRQIWNQHAYFAAQVDDKGYAVESFDMWSRYLKNFELLGFRNNISMPPFLDTCK